MIEGDALLFFESLEKWELIRFIEKMQATIRAQDQQLMSLVQKKCVCGAKRKVLRYKYYCPRINNMRDARTQYYYCEVCEK